MIEALAVAAGAAVGAPARYWTDVLVSGRFGPADGTRIPAGTLAVNVIGSAVLAVLHGRGVGGAWLLALGTGFCGSFTTFATFAGQTDRLAGRAGRLVAAANVLLSVVLCCSVYWAAWRLSGGPAR